MITVKANPITEEWAIIDAKPDQQTLDDLIVRGPVVVKSLLGDSNQIWMGRPEVLGIQKDISNCYDLVLIQFACSFRPAPECDFVSATIQIEIEDQLPSKESPIVHDIFPREVVMPVTYKRTFAFDPNAKISLEKIAQIEVSALKLENSSEYILYQPQITTFGKGTEQFGWDFNKTKSQKIIGVKDLFFVVKKLPNHTAILHFKIMECFVQTYIGKVPLSSLLLTGGEGIFYQKDYLLK